MWGHRCRRDLTQRRKDAERNDCSEKYDVGIRMRHTLHQNLRQRKQRASNECYLNTIDLNATKEWTMGMAKRNPILAGFGRNVRSRREAKDLTQEKLAEMADLDRTFISDVERGGRNLSLLNIQRIAKALGTSISELTYGLGG